MAYLSTVDFFESKYFPRSGAAELKGRSCPLGEEANAEKLSRNAEDPPLRPDAARLGKRAYSYSEMPDVVRDNRSFAPRGAELPDGLPDLQAEVSQKGEVWAYNTEGYYEEAMTRQWNATLDVPWQELAKAELPDEIGRAYAQLLTFLTEVKMIATDVPAEGRGRLNNNLMEVKIFRAPQVRDEARHAKVSRKRALTTG